MSNIYDKLRFKKTGDFIYPVSIVNEAKAIFNKIPLKNIGIRPLIVEEAVFEETFAISTAEDSELTENDAKKIEVSEEQKARIIKYKDNNKLDVRGKYDSLEFENIRAVENQVDSLSFEDINIDLICDLHHDLTIGMDEYSSKLGISKYHSGRLRASNRVRIGKLRKYTPPPHRDIKALLKLLFKEFAKRKNINLYDILEFHILFYAIHPFQNGNKRVSRILESLLLDHYNYGVNRALSLATYYGKDKSSCNLFLMESLLQKNVYPFINFAIRGYFYAGYDLFGKTNNIYMNEFAANFERYIRQHIKPLHQSNYKKAGKSIVKLNGAFTHTDFVNKMKKYRCSLGVSQMIIKNLISRKILNRQENIYYFEKALEIKELMKNLTGFLLRNNIEI